MYNFINQNVFSVAIGLLMTYVTVLCSVCIIGLHREIPEYQIFLFGILAFDTTLAVIEAEGKAKGGVLSKSKECLSDVKKWDWVCKRKVVRKCLKSCPDLKVLLGSYQSYDVAVGLQLANFNVSRTVDALLLL